MCDPRHSWSLAHVTLATHGALHVFTSAGSIASGDKSNERVPGATEGPKEGAGEEGRECADA